MQQDKGAVFNGRSIPWWKGSKTAMDNFLEFRAWHAMLQLLFGIIRRSGRLKPKHSPGSRLQQWEYLSKD